MRFSWIISSLVLASCLSGCAESSLFVKDGTADYESDTGTEDSASSYLRIDVHPSNKNPDLLPETHVLNGSWSGVYIDVQSPVRLSGTILGYDATPHVAAEVPGESSVPVQAFITAVKADSVMSGGALSDLGDGKFEFLIPAGSDYTFAVVPEDPLELPFVVETDRAFYQNEEISFDLDYAAPLFGRITNSQGAPVAGVAVQAIDPVSGVGGPTVISDAQGYYLLRVYPGEYLLDVQGQEGSYLPRVQEQVLIEDEDGIRHDVLYGETTSTSVSGLVTHDDNVAEDDVTVRFSSTQLAGFESASIVLETDTDRNGRFNLSLLPGHYNVEYIPSWGHGLTPLLTSLDVVEGGISQTLEPVNLSGLVTLRSRIVDANGVGVPNVGVMVTETGFDGFTYFTTTDGLGNLIIDVPNTEVMLTLSPPQGVLAAITHYTLSASEAPETLALDLGQEVSGQVQHLGSPVSWALVELRDANDRLYGKTLTDKSGDFSVRISWSD